jgi:archaellum biogenesis protein FlaJ (TadC family)
MSSKISSKESQQNFKQNIFFVLFCILVGGVIYFFNKNIYFATAGSLILFFALKIYFYFKKKLVISADIRRMEEVFPDFIELVSSNLRAGMTIDRALMASSRKEFDPLDKQILFLGKDIMTGKSIALALSAMGKRTGSEKIQKTIDLIVSGLRSGGDVAVLLEETAVNIRERAFVEKRAASNVLMYIILIAFAIAVGAPALFALSSVLVGVMTEIMGDMPQTDTSMNLPFSLSEVSISVNFITIYAIIFLTVIAILSSMLLGLVSKGDEKEGLKYAPIFIGVSWVVFFVMKNVLLNAFSNVF